MSIKFKRRSMMERLKIGGSKEQREGVARFLDTLAAAATVGWVVGVEGYSEVSRMDLVLLFLVCPILLSFSWKIRRSA